MRHTASAPAKIVSIWGAFLLLALGITARGAEIKNASAADATSATAAVSQKGPLPQYPDYEAQPHQFPPLGSTHRIRGELVRVDFIHRLGEYRDVKTGELRSFQMPPYSSLYYLNAGANLRDIPLGNQFDFFFNRDADGELTSLVTLEDQFTQDSRAGISYRVDTVDPSQGRLIVTKQNLSQKKADLGQQTLLLTPSTQIRKGTAEAALDAVKVGDSLLFNLSGDQNTASLHCSQVWVGQDTQELASEEQQTKFNEFLKARGLAGWIDQVSDKTLTVTFFDTAGRNPEEFKSRWKNDFSKDQSVRVAVANEELRTWNPPVDGDRARVIALHEQPAEVYGSSGVSVEVKTGYMLEGFRKGRIVRIFGAGWTVQDQFFGESLMGYGYRHPKNDELKENLAKEYPDQFPFRTDYSNRHLPWFQLKAGEKPPQYAEHVVYGELKQLDARARTGQFLTDRTGTPVEFTLTDTAHFRLANKPINPAKLPPNKRYRFHLFEDDKGNFTQVDAIVDQQSEMIETHVAYRITSLDLENGRAIVAWQLPLIMNYDGDLEQPHDIGQSILRFGPETVVTEISEEPIEPKDAKAPKNAKDSKNAKPLTRETLKKVSDLKVGDALQVNYSGELPGKPMRCLEIWIVPTEKVQTKSRAKP